MCPHLHIQPLRGAESLCRLIFSPEIVKFERKGAAQAARAAHAAGVARAVLRAVI
eukprot:COSAG05_NODE_10095_length_583_cov_1.070248_1_plen_54_part_10